MQVQCVCGGLGISGSRTLPTFPRSLSFLQHLWDTFSLCLCWLHLFVTCSESILLDFPHPFVYSSNGKKPQLFYDLLLGWISHKIKCPSEAWTGTENFVAKLLFELILFFILSNLSRAGLTPSLFLNLKIVL